MTFNEIRQKYNLEPLPGGDVPANPVYLQTVQMAQQQQQNDQQNDQQQKEYEDGQDPFGSDQGEDNEEENPFTKSLQGEIEELLCTEV